MVRAEFAPLAIAMVAKEVAAFSLAQVRGYCATIALNSCAGLLGPRLAAAAASDKCATRRAACYTDLARNRMRPAASQWKCARISFEFRFIVIKENTITTIVVALVSEKEG